MVKIYHNQRCTKSRNTLEILNEKGVEVQVIDYQQSPPTKDELKEILQMLRMRPLELIRKGEEIFREKYKGKDLTDDEWLDVMLAHPKLIERPIVVNGSKAVIGRPPENVTSIL